MLQVSQDMIFATAIGVGGGLAGLIFKAGRKLQHIEDILKNLPCRKNGCSVGKEDEE